MRITKRAHRVSISMSHIEFEVLKKVHHLATLGGGDKLLRHTLTPNEHKSYGRRVSGYAEYLRVDKDLSHG